MRTNSKINDTKTSKSRKWKTRGDDSQVGDSSMSQVPKKRGIGRKSTLILNVLRFGYSLIIEDEKK